jgi:hypothetical protein
VSLRWRAAACSLRCRRARRRSARSSSFAPWLHCTRDGAQTWGLLCRPCQKFIMRPSATGACESPDPGIFTSRHSSCNTTLLSHLVGIFFTVAVIMSRRILDASRWQSMRQPWNDAWPADPRYRRVGPASTRDPSQPYRGTWLTESLLLLARELI